MTDSNSFLLGINTQNKNVKPSDTLINHLRQLEEANNQIVENNKPIQNNKPKQNNNSEQNNKSGKKIIVIDNTQSKESITKVINDLITKLEYDVYTLNNQIKNFNVEKKAIIDLNSKEIGQLKEIIKTIYMLIVTMSKSIELGKDNRIEALEKLRKTIQQNTGFKKIIDEVMKNNKRSGSVNSQNSIKILNILNNNRAKSVNSLNNIYSNVKNKIEISTEQKKINNNNAKNINRTQFTNFSNMHENHNNMNRENNNLHSKNYTKEKNNLHSNHNAENNNLHNKSHNGNIRVENNIHGNHNTENNNLHKKSNNGNMNVENNNLHNKNHNGNMNVENNNLHNKSHNNINIENNNHSGNMHSKKYNNLNIQSPKQYKKISNKILNTTITNNNAKKRLNQHFL